MNYMVNAPISNNGIGGNMANMMMRNYLLAENLTQTKPATLPLVQQHHSVPRRQPQAAVGDNYTNPLFLLMDPLGDSHHVSRYY
jgi:hypothetical protein